MAISSELHSQILRLGGIKLAKPKARQYRGVNRETLPEEIIELYESYEWPNEYRYALGDNIDKDNNVLGFFMARELNLGQAIIAVIHDDDFDQPIEKYNAIAFIAMGHGVLCFALDSSDYSDPTMIYVDEDDSDSADSWYKSKIRLSQMFSMLKVVPEDYEDDD